MGKALITAFVRSVAFGRKYNLRRGSVEAQNRSDRDRAAWAGLLERRDATPTRRAEWADRPSMERGPLLREQVGVDRGDAGRPVERRFAAGVPPNQGSGARDAQARGGYGSAGGARQSAPEPRRVDPRPVREDPRQADPRQSNPRQADQRQADPRREVRPEVRPEAQPPSTNSAMLESLSALGFTRKQCDEALKRFSSMEAAVQWIVESSDDKGVPDDFFCCLCDLVRGLLAQQRLRLSLLWD